MKRIPLLIFSSGICYSCFSQLSVTGKTTITTLNPTWLQVKPSGIKKNGVHQDSVYYFKSQEKGRDSALIMIQYFDSVGNLTERDEFNVKAKGEIVRVNRLSYLEDELLQKEVSAKTIDLFKSTRYQKELYLYEYDSAGNNITEKLYEYFGDSLNKYKITVFENLYDSAAHIVKSYRKSGSSDRFLQRTYTYKNGILDEINNYDSNYEVVFTNVYRLDTKKNIERIYLTDVSPDNLMLEFFYDDKRRVKQEKRYFEESHSFTPGYKYNSTITQNYWYGADDLIEKQVVKTEHDGTSYFYKHYYSRQ